LSGAIRVARGAAASAEERWGPGGAMAAQDPVEETRRLIGLGCEQILAVTPDNFDRDATDAWPAFRRGVVRAEGCREVPADELLGAVEGKARVLAFLADFAERKRAYRKQVETVLRILLKGPQWMEAARSDPAMSARLPGTEVAEMLSAAKGDEAAAGAAAKARAEAATLAQAPPRPPRCERTESRQNILEATESSFKALVAMGDHAKLDEAASAVAQFSEGVAETLKRSFADDIEVVARLEPKAPVLRLLCTLHEKRRSERSIVTSLLFSLMETPSLTRWRAEADANPELRGELEGLGVMDHAYGNDLTAGSGDEKSVTPTETPSVSSSAECQAIWMWRDAGTYGGWFVHKLATLNPTRWSAAASIEETIADLEQYLDTPQGERPVKVRVFGGGLEPTTSKTSSAAGAVAALRMLLTRP